MEQVDARGKMEVVVIVLRRRVAHSSGLLLSRLLHIFISQLRLFSQLIDGRGTHHLMAIVPEECLVTSIYVEADCTRYREGIGCLLV